MNGNFWDCIEGYQFHCLGRNGSGEDLVNNVQDYLKGWLELLEESKRAQYNTPGMLESWREHVTFDIKDSSWAPVCVWFSDQSKRKCDDVSCQAKRRKRDDD